MTTAPMPAAASGDPFASFGCESTSRADWLKVGVGLASLVPLVAAAGTQDVLAASGGGSNVVTVLGAGGKTGRECVEYLGARGTSECTHHHNMVHEKSLCSAYPRYAAATY